MKIDFSQKKILKIAFRRCHHSSYRVVFGLWCVRNSWYSQAKETLHWRAIHQFGCWKVQSISYNGFIYVQPSTPFIILSVSRPCPKNCWNMRARLCLAKRREQWHTAWLWVREARLLDFLKCVNGWSGLRWNVQLCGISLRFAGQAHRPWLWLVEFFPHQNHRGNTFFYCLLNDTSPVIIRAYLFAEIQLRNIHKAPRTV